MKNSNKIIGSIKESDIFPDQVSTPEGEWGEERQSVRIVLFDNQGKIALGFYPSNNTSEEEYLLPGGGVEKNEPILDALVRESLEETGCHIKNIKKLGIIKEYGVGKKRKHNQDTYCFTAEVDGEKMLPQYTKKEQQDLLEVHWLTLEKALEAINNQPLSFNKVRSLMCLEEVRKSKTALAT